MFFMIRQQIRRFIGYKAMEAHPESNVRVYSRYDHSDSCKYFRWTARESFRFMYDRPWQEVNNFYSNMVNGHSSLFDLFSDEVGERSFIHDTARTQEVTNPAQCEDVSNEGKSRRWERVTFKVVLSYHGISFDGWQKQPGLSTVQSLIESSLGKFVDDRKAQLLKDKHKPLEGCAVVAGRTDKGVSALGQVCSFYTWRKDVAPHDIEDAINSTAPGKIRVTFVSKVSRVFHPNFSAKWRRYLYIFPFSGGEYREQNFETQENFEDFSYYENCHDLRNECGEFIVNEENAEHPVVLDKEELGEARKSMWFSVCRVNQLLQQLEGKLLSYKVFARDTKASRNM
uniref:Uncharacterized protein LOC105120901 isoform X1 n=1 Tax=Rhizophora mucronata TaxID=61149 RepID=A0A2P2K134_RHIMU